MPDSVNAQETEGLRRRRAPIDMSADEFRAAGHALVDRIAEFLGSLPRRPVTPAERPSRLRTLLPEDGAPRHGAPAEDLLSEAADLLFDHSLFNGHPRFMGYVTASAAPIGALADLLAAAVNPNVGAWALSPMASEIEAQTVRWIAELIGYPTDAGGLLVSGGNMANFVGFVAGRRARAAWDVRAGGVIGAECRPLRVYTSAETHTWVQKAADLFGLGTDSIRWIPTDDRQRMRTDVLLQRIREDRERGDRPLMVIGAAGTVGTGAVDPLDRLADIAAEHGLWLHVDGAYGGLAAMLPEAGPDLRALARADSVAVDPHKWLYAPLEVGCALVRDRSALRDAFSYHPVYYNFTDEEDPGINFYEYGLQNSRGFRALKVWLALRQVGREGYERMLRDDIALARALFERMAAEPEVEAVTHNLSIATFRYVPRDVDRADPEGREYLNRLNAQLLSRIQASGEAYVSGHQVGDRYVLRACIVNFRTGLEDVEALPGIVTRLGRQVHAELRVPAPSAP